MTPFNLTSTYIHGLQIIKCIRVILGTYYGFLKVGMCHPGRCYTSCAELDRQPYIISGAYLSFNFEAFRVGRVTLFTIKPQLFKTLPTRWTT